MLGIADLAAADPRLPIDQMHRAVALVLVGDAGGVAQQVLDRHRPAQWDELQLALVDDTDLLVGEFRDELGDGVGEQQVAVLEQHHDAGRDDRFCHREDAEDRIMGHRRRCRRVLPAQRLEPADLATACHQHGDAGDGSLVDLALECVRHRLQADRRQADGFRLGLRQGRGLRRANRLRGGLGVHDVSRTLVVCGEISVWLTTPGVEQMFRTAARQCN
jgi:hypothetical protein